MMDVFEIKEESNQIWDSFGAEFTETESKFKETSPSDNSEGNT